MLKWHAEYQLYTDSYALRLVDKQGDSVMHAATSIVMEKRDPGMYVDPFITMSGEEMQSLFNTLWSQGFRPKDGTGNSGHIEAMKYHLEDMRKLVFKDSE